jgi:hypothetical protein
MIAADSVLPDGSIISWINFVVLQRRMITSESFGPYIEYTEGKKLYGISAIKILPELSGQMSLKINNFRWQLLIFWQHLTIKK